MYDVLVKLNVGHDFGGEKWLNADSNAFQTARTSRGASEDLGLKVVDHGFPK